MNINKIIISIIFKLKNKTKMEIFILILFHNLKIITFLKKILFLKN